MECQLAIIPENDSYRFDEPITLRLVFKNTGSEKVAIARKTRPAQLTKIYSFEVYLPNGNPAPLTLEGQRQCLPLRGQRPKPIYLEPGEKNEDYVPMLNRIYDMTLSGEYIIKAHRYYH